MTYQKEPEKGTPEYFAKYPWARVEEPVKRDHQRGGETWSHPAYGQLEIMRTSGSTDLYDSEFKHQHFITIRLNRSELHRDLARDWHFAKDHLAEVNLSEAQWATFVSAIGTGGGVPCTIKYVAHEGHMPRIPPRKTENIYRQEGAAAMESAKSHLQDLRAKISDASSKLSKAQQANLVGEVDRAISKLMGTLPFIAESFAEHMENSVEKAKAEVHGYVQAHIVRAGLASLGSPLAIDEAAPRPAPVQEGGDNE
jgi:hypothetical protein